jgi:hypothetical protein
LSGAFTSLHCSKALEFTVLAPIWTTNPAKPFLVPIFFIYNHSSDVPWIHSFFLSALPLPQNEYQSFWKKSILFLIFHKFWNFVFCFYFFIFIFWNLFCTIWPSLKTSSLCFRALESKTSSHFSLSTHCTCGIRAGCAQQKLCVFYWCPVKLIIKIHFYGKWFFPLNSANFLMYETTLKFKKNHKKQGLNKKRRFFRVYTRFCSSTALRSARGFRVWTRFFN